ncbi:hypothetical protein AGMMS50276_16060 [Synergistales bacterium]|nr:hypothetical protein AGMMS50276_16060 [Synergistales bacterium]
MKNLKSRRFVLALAVSLLCASPVGASDYVEGESVVLLRNDGEFKLSAAGMSGASIQNYAARVAGGGSVLKTYDALSEASGNIFAHIKSGAESTEELVSRLKKNPNVLSAIPNYIGHIANTTPNDPKYDELWGIKAINAPDAWDVTSGDESVYTAVIDTGVSINHEDLNDNIDIERSNSFISDAVMDDHGHGTHVSGIIGAIGDNNIGVVGVNWRVKMIEIKIAGADGTLTIADEIAAADYIAGLIDSGVNIKAVNMSFGGWYPKDMGKPGTAYYEAYKALGDKNAAVMVMAAGNEGHEVGAPNPEEFRQGEESVLKGYYIYPSSLLGIDNMIVVGAIDKTYSAASFSNWSEQMVDVTAPGLSIMSTAKNDTYELMSGTSMATPHVTGAAALLSARHPDWSASEVKNALLYTARGDINPIKNTAKISAFGLIDVSKAIAYNQNSHVAARSVSSISMDGKSGDANSITIKKGNSITLSAEVLPSEATDKRVEWTSSNSGVAYITGGGVLRAVAHGSATITARPIRGGEPLSVTVNVAKSSGGGCEVGLGLAALVLTMIFIARRPFFLDKSSLTPK